MKTLSTWKWLVFVGTALIIGGIFCLLNPFYSYMKLVGYSGILFLINGIFLLFVSATAYISNIERNWMWTESVLHFVFGCFLLLNPLFTFFIYSYVIAIWVILLGSIKIIAALSLRSKLTGWQSVLLIGAGLMVFGLIILFHKLEKAQNLTDLIGLFGLMMGVLYLIDAIRYRKWKETLDMML